MKVAYRYRIGGCAAVASILALGCTDSSGPEEPATGAMRVQISTLGASIDFDPDGYSVIIDDGTPRSIGNNTVTLVDGLAAGTHVVRVDGVAPNCSIAGNPQSVNVIASRKGSTPSLAAFSVTCVANVGSLLVSTSISGDERDSDGYRLLLAGGRTVALPVDGTVTVSDVRVGQPVLQLVDVAPNCDFEDQVPKPVNVTFGGQAAVSFSVRCAATGSLQVTTATTGVDGPDAYGLLVSLPAKNFSSSFGLPAQGSTNIDRLPPGNYMLTLSNIVMNCVAPLPNPRAVTITSGASTSVAFDVACLATSRLAYEGNTGGRREIFVVRSNGTGNTKVPLQQGANTSPAWSPDGSRIAFTSDRDGNGAIYTMDANGENTRRLTGDPANDYQPAWSPDGTKLAFVSQRDATREIYVMNADGSDPVRLTNNLASDEAPSWSPDGSRIVFQSDRAAAGRTSIWIMNADGSGARQLTANDRSDSQPAWSPDGSVIAFSRANTSGSSNIFLIAPDGSGLRAFTADQYSATDPSWSPDGSQIAFTSEACDYYYYNYCETFIIIASVSAAPSMSRLTLVNGANPSWHQ